MNDEVVAAIVTTKVSMLFNFPFYGTLITRMNVIQADAWCDTAATDGRNFYYNREFIKSLTDDERLFLFCHEVLHCVYEHLGRKGMRDPKIWNMANDYIVNYTLKKGNVGSMPLIGLYDPKYNDEMTSEEVYRLLEQNSTKIELCYTPMDMHLDLDGQGEEGNGTKKVSVTIMGDSNGPPRMTEEDKQQIRNELRAAVINAAQAHGADKVPAGVRRLIDAFTNPVMDWQTLLEMHIQSQIKDDYTYTRPNKRSWSSGRRIIFPGQNYKKRVELMAFIDLSGSMTDQMIRDFLSETRGIMQQFEDFQLILATFDTKVYNPKIFTPDNVDDIITYETHGGGGTMFECMFDFMRDPGSFGYEEDFPDPIIPPKLVVFTDGLPNSTWGEEEYTDTLFIIHTHTTIVAPFGMTAYYQKET